MDSTNRLEAVYAPSEDVVAREIAGELVIVPLAAGIGDMEDEIYTLNETGRAIWEQLNQRKSLRDIAAALVEDFEAPPGEIEGDVVGLVQELVRRKMLVEIDPVH